MVDKNGKLEPQDIWEKKDQDFNFENLLEPYREGGTVDHPVRRTWGTVVDYLINKKRYPVDVVGAGIMLTLFRIKKEGHFKGNGSYGSAGAEFVSNIRVACDMINQERLVSATYKAIAESRAPEMKLMVLKEGFEILPWWVKLFSFKYWKFRSWRKKNVSTQRVGHRSNNK